MPYMDLESDRLFYAAHDHEGRRNLIGIHGSGADHHIWPGGLASLPDCNVWLPDLPGHGHSDGPPRKHVDAYADIISGFRETLALDRVTLIGHSMGGAVALSLALRNPDWLDGLILICTGARLKVLPEMRELVRTDFPAAMDRLAVMGFSPGAPTALREAYKAQLLEQDPDVFDADFEACDTFDVTDSLTRITQQTLIISGDIDHMTPLKYSQFLEDRIPNARLAVIAPAGHQLPREQPDDMVHIIRRFLQREARGNEYSR